MNTPTRVCMTHTPPHMSRVANNPGAGQGKPNHVTLLEQLAAEEVDVYIPYKQGSPKRNQDTSGSESCIGTNKKNGQTSNTQKANVSFLDEDKKRDIATSVRETSLWVDDGNVEGVKDMSFREIFDGEEGEELRQLLGVRGMRMLEEWESNSMSAELI